jgi:hypothetical protein
MMVSPIPAFQEANSLQELHNKRSFSSWLTDGSVAWAVEAPALDQALIGMRDASAKPGCGKSSGRDAVAMMTLDFCRRYWGERA